jgi:hypothetical protein
MLPIGIFITKSLENLMLHSTHPSLGYRDDLMIQAIADQAVLRMDGGEVFALLWGFACLDALDASGVIGFLNRYFN